MDEKRPTLILAVDAFVRSLTVSRQSGHVCFLGAGASVSSGVPCAESCIWEWKRSIFLSNNPGLEDQFSELSIPSVKERIQKWIDSCGSYPARGDADEYGIYVEDCYPISSDRRQYFQNLIEEAKPHVGYQLLALLAKAGVIPSVWTTNFDRLLSAASALVGTTVVEVGLDTVPRLTRQMRRGELRYVALHGDYRYDALKNTGSEIQKQDEELRMGFVEEIRKQNLIVVGYSGRDRSILDSLREAYRESGSSRLYWCGYDEPEPNASVQSLLCYVREYGHEAYYVPTFGFDDLLQRISLHCLDGQFIDKVRELQSGFGKRTLKPVPFRIEAPYTSGIVKSNAFAVRCPKEVLQFEASGFDSEGAWRRLREQTEGLPVVAGLHRGKVLALGTIADVERAFHDNMRGSITLTPIDDREMSFADGVVVGLLRCALVRSIAEGRGLETDGKRLIWRNVGGHTVSAFGLRCTAYDAAILSLRRYAGEEFLVIKPTVRGTGEAGEEISKEMQQEVKRQLLTKQYNRQFNQAIEFWRKVIFLGGTGVFEFPPNAGGLFKFEVKQIPGFAEILTDDHKASISLPANVRRHIRYSGTEYSEPRLLFSKKDGKGVVADSHPVRGILQNRPYDYPLTQSALSSEIRIGVICPGTDTARLSAYLSSMHERRTVETKREYLLDYPGFQKAFGIHLEIPLPQEEGWIECEEPDAHIGGGEVGVELGRRISGCIERLVAGWGPTVVLIYIPDRWRKWEFSYDGNDRFDLHDFVKARCVQKGISTQFLREATLLKMQQCEIMWWLALSFYAKAMRTPWVLDDLDTNTAFLGLGFSVDTCASKGTHVILGCSHIYSSEGLGLRYRLSKIENPFIRRGNPFMSREDAVRVGGSVRELCFQARSRLPNRVVIHKRTPFLAQEREGLLEGLGGISQIDMVEIEIEKMVRYVASRIVNGQFQGDGFPVRRGTAIVLDSRRALLWVHGTTAAITHGRHYYLGKSRIPAPIVIIRHHGTSGIRTLAREILGLSKMSWNTFDMYSKVPATIKSCSEIARIGALLERFGPMSYDYRLFI